LVLIKGKKPYFSAISNKKIQRAIEFFDHNLSIQRGSSPKKTNRVIFVRNQGNRANAVR
jgi:hypothetical protein